MEKRPIKIEPIPIRPRRSARRIERFSLFRWGAGLFLGLVLIFLSVSAWFVFTARQVVITIDPVPESIAFSGSVFTPRIGDYYLMRPGEYTLAAHKACFLPLEHRFRVSADKQQGLRLKMQRRPGRLEVHAHLSNLTDRRIDGAQVYIDGDGVGNTPLENLEIAPGLRKLEVRAENYQDLQTEVQVHGCGKLQVLNLALVPGWSDIVVSSVPQGANVQIDGRSFGNTPLSIQLAAGNYLLEIRADGCKTWSRRLAVKPNEPQEIKDIKLEPADGKLAIHTKPAGANVLIGERFFGQTPLKVDLSPSKDHMVQISMPGYEKTTRKVQVPSSKFKQLDIKLKPIKGVVRLWVEPADTELLVNGKSWGVAPGQLNLIALEHTLEFKKKGYRSQRIRITPRPGFPQELKISLKKEGLAQETAPTVITTQTGYRLKLIQPKPYTMGSSRREQGRQSNETLRKVKLIRPFYMGLKELTNAEFKEFMPRHDSGSFKSKPLNNADQPVARVTWEKSALFCNWLSAKEALPAAYVKKGETLVAVKPLNTGYRLPTEAEWEFCARIYKDQTPLKYPWGQKFPPGKLSGNYSDQSAKDLLPTDLGRYNDGYVTTAPPATFEPNRLGFYDMGGNVAEWCHDYYSIYSYAPEKIFVDPVGPDKGKHHVIRGSSWKHGSIGTLRLAYRSYGDGTREDVGFRVCRYLK